MKMIVAFLLAVGTLQRAAAIFEDQAGTHDWYRQHLGLISNAFFHPSKPIVCVSTAQALVACLNLRDGAVSWRKIIGSNDEIPLFTQLLPKAKLLVTAAEGYVRTFDLDGNMRWQRSFPTRSAEASLSVLSVPDDAKERLLLLQNGILLVRKGAES